MRARVPDSDASAGEADEEQRDVVVGAAIRRAPRAAARRPSPRAAGRSTRRRAARCSVARPSESDQSPALDQPVAAHHQQVAGSRIVPLQATRSVGTPSGVEAPSSSWPLRPSARKSSGGRWPALPTCSRPVAGIEDRDHQRGDLVGVEVTEEPVQAGEHPHRRGIDDGDAPQRVADLAHRAGGPHAPAHDVAEDQPSGRRRSGAGRRTSRRRRPSRSASGSGRPPPGRAPAATARAAAPAGAAGRSSGSARRAGRGRGPGRSARPRVVRNARSAPSSPRVVQTGRPRWASDSRWQGGERPAAPGSAGTPAQPSPSIRPAARRPRSRRSPASSSAAAGEPSADVTTAQAQRRAPRSQDRETTQSATSPTVTARASCGRDASARTPALVRPAPR